MCEGGRKGKEGREEEVAELEGKTGDKSLRRDGERGRNGEGERKGRNIK